MVLCLPVPTTLGICGTSAAWVAYSNTDEIPKVHNTALVQGQPIRPAPGGISVDSPSPPLQTVNGFRPIYHHLALPFPRAPRPPNSSSLPRSSAQDRSSIARFSAASRGFGGSSLNAAMSRSGDPTPRQRAVSSTSQSSKADGVAENVSSTPHQTVTHCQAEEFENIGGPLHKNDVHCFKEGDNITNSEVVARVKWSKEEDKILTQMINKHGLKNWQTIAHAIPGRSAQQCRQRWRYRVDSAINKEAWSQQEELRLIRAHQIYGTKWREMVKHFPGRTNGAIKDYWRGPMKRKLNSYLASGLLEQFPDVLEDLSVPQNSDSDILKDVKGSDILKDTEGSSDRNELSSALPTSSKSKLRLTLLGVNADTSEGESSDFMYVSGDGAHSAEVPQRITARSEQHARTRRKLDFLSSPVELKASTVAVNSQNPLQKSEQMSPAVCSISPSNGCQDVSPEVPSECANPVLLPTSSYQTNDVHSMGTSDPCSPELQLSDLMEMSYFDSLMIFPPGSPHDGNSI